MKIPESFTERRRTFRRAARGEMAVLGEGGWMELGTLRDISLGGLSFRLSEPVPVREEFHVVIGGEILPDLRMARVVSSKCGEEGCIIRAEFIS